MYKHRTRLNGRCKVAVFLSSNVRFGRFGVVPLGKSFAELTFLGSEADVLVEVVLKNPN